MMGLSTGVAHPVYHVAGNPASVDNPCLRNREIAVSVDNRVDSQDPQKSAAFWLSVYCLLSISKEEKGEKRALLKDTRTSGRHGSHPHPQESRA